MASGAESISGSEQSGINSRVVMFSSAMARGSTMERECT
jgi:hypothetical protein